ncbi:F-box protein At4g09920-like [Chenopodium quinoa]|uniref:F-box domain-containing protein n=1 Tax=Chenopodium quinoa TaxID=63459 RepID=A0A803LZR4_CHEQI|nr:F-box protein At4g09920-like [Chenopodium quinoa]XP_021749199.1 F-box protein At4g09920-like [Chenopodium quinoa]
MKTPKKDRISYLPDELLIHILSFLPMKEAVATSALSKRWKKTYTWLSRLEFDAFPICHCQKRPYLIDSYHAFEMYVDNVLKASQSQKITTFRLHFGGYCEIRYPSSCNRVCFPDMEPMRLNAWLTFPLARAVRELDIYARVRTPGNLPSTIFVCGTLELLKLDVNLDLDVPLSVRLPNLKEFNLSLIFFPFDDSVARLVSSCPSLQRLDLYGAWLPEAPLVISSPSLHRLAIENVLEYDGRMCKVEFNVPNLEYLDHFDTCPRSYSIAHLNALVEADIELVEGCGFDSRVVLGFVCLMSNVQHLSLRYWLVLGLHYVDASELNRMLPVFRNLKSLRLGCCGYYDWNKLLMGLLNCAPFLEELTLTQGIRYVGDETDDAYMMVSDRDCQPWRRTQTVPSCLGSHFKKFVIMECYHSELDREIIKYFMRNSLVLEELVVVVCHPSVTQAARTYYEELPRASITCSVTVTDK